MARSQLVKDYNNSREVDPNCANCDGFHTDNFSKCLALLEEKENRHPKRPNTTKLPYNHDFTTLSNNSVSGHSQSTLPISYQPNSFQPNFVFPNISYTSKPPLIHFPPPYNKPDCYNSPPYRHDRSETSWTFTIRSETPSWYPTNKRNISIK